ncbi:signal recognition particle receptor subunit beta [Agrilus planipennis]|uniref:Signal recognition particle receptor subunit beta n=1 Tax=Agrilus planipennis TaxID=224129 RepID=A0A1W4XF93_AGRPL|nr:signal recognition particle receptor subunit beta [Agrilus planipennis]
MDSNYIKLIISVLTVLVTLILYVVYQRARKSRRSILLVGLRESGKTLTFTQLIHGQYVETFTSIKENIGDYETNNGTVRIIDIPGHEQLRYKFFDKYKSNARALVYIIDSTLNSANLRDTAECLYNILSDSVVINNRLPVLVLCNKQDISTASNNDLLKQQLEEEFALLRVTKSHQLESVDLKAQKSAFLGREGEKFKFEDLPIKVSFAETCAILKDNYSSKKGLDDFKKWLIKVA